MDNKHVRGVLFQLFYIFLFVNSYRIQSNIPRILSHLLGSNSPKKPLILIVDLSKKPRTSEPEDFFSLGDGEFSNKDYEYREYIENRDDSNVHSLYHLLKNIKTEPSSSDESYEATQQVLRSTLRSQCRKVDSCVQKCPSKKPSCPKKCQQELDTLNLCPPPDPRENKPCCNEPKRGKTMPPYWRF